MKEPENSAIQLFEDQKIRVAWDAEREEWYFSIVDAVAVLTDSPDYNTGRKYWNKLKQRLKEEEADRKRQLKLEDEERRRAQKLEDEARRKAEREKEKKEAEEKRKAERIRSKIETQLISAGGQMLKRGLLGILKK